MKRVLVLGAGLVVKPLLDDLLERPDVQLSLATLNIERARALLAERPRATALEINATNEAQLLPEVGQAQVVVSLLPADQHVRIARACLHHCVPLVTTSYISDGMRALDAGARECDVLLLNEVGLDPGVDHICAVEVIRRVQRQGGRVLSSISYCGALPAPEANTNPWGYKFAWSPRGLVLAARNPVRYLEEGRIIERPFPDLFDAPRFLEIPGIGHLEAYPNRDCLRYREAYGLGELRDFYRGTLRYPGWCRTWQALFDLGLLDLEEQDWSRLSYAEFLSRQLPPGPGGLAARLACRLGLSQDHDVIRRLEWAGLLSDLPIPQTVASPLEVLTGHLQDKLRYAPGERDAVILEHHFTARRANGRLRKIIKRMLVHGTAGDDSALARTVALPAAIACRLLLDRRVNLAGVRIPVDPQLAEPILRGLAQRGLRLDEIEEDLPSET